VLASTTFFCLFASIPPGNAPTLIPPLQKRIRVRHRTKGALGGVREKVGGGEPQYPSSLVPYTVHVPPLSSEAALWFFLIPSELILLLRCPLVSLSSALEGCTRGFPALPGKSGRHSARSCSPRADNFLRLCMALRYTASITESSTGVGKAGEGKVGGCRQGFSFAPFLFSLMPHSHSKRISWNV